MEDSKNIFANHPVTKADSRRQASSYSNMVMGSGATMQLDSYKDLYGLHGGIITAVDLLKGLAVLAGLEAPNIEGANGLINTTYAGKVEAAIEILQRDDFVYVHIEAPDECGHLGMGHQKLRLLNYLMRMFVNLYLNGLKKKVIHIN